MKSFVAKHTGQVKRPTQNGKAGRMWKFLHISKHTFTQKSAHVPARVLHLVFGELWREARKKLDDKKASWQQTGKEHRQISYSPGKLRIHARFPLRVLPHSYLFKKLGRRGAKRKEGRKIRLLSFHWKADSLSHKENVPNRLKYTKTKNVQCCQLLVNLPCISTFTSNLATQSVCTVQTFLCHSDLQEGIRDRAAFRGALPSPRWALAPPPPYFWKVDIP